MARKLESDPIHDASSPIPSDDIEHTIAAAVPNTLMIL
jgi:hypothetical protein